MFVRKCLMRLRFRRIVAGGKMKNLLKAFLGDTHPVYHAVVLGVAVYAAWKIARVEERLDEFAEKKDWWGIDEKTIL
jgi:hypothetical protein